LTEDQDNLQEINAKLDKLLKIFEDAMSELKSASSGLSPAVEEKIDKLLEQNGEIADGIVAIADIVTELKQAVESKSGAPLPPRPPSRPLPPPIGPRVPPPPKRGLFGI